MQEPTDTPKKSISFKDFVVLEPHDPTQDPDGLLTYKARKRRMNLGIDEEAEQVDEALTVQQRLKRKLIFKRNAAKIRLGREKSSRRIASRDVLMKRAIMQAKGRIAIKLLGGRHKDEVSFSERARVEVLLAKRKKSIIRIAMKLLPALRKKEQSKFSTKMVAMPKDKQHSETVI